MSEINMDTSAEQLSAGLVITVIQDVLKRWHVILAAALMAAMMAFVYVDATYTPVYRTATTFVVSSGSTTSTAYTNLSTASNTAVVFTEVLNSSILRSKVLQEAGLSHFDGKISASVAEETNLLTMTVTGSDPRSVFLVSRSVIENHHIVSQQALGDTIMEVLSYPVAPASPVNPKNTKQAVVRAAVLAAAAAAVVLATIAYLSDKIRSRKDAETKLSCHVLGELFHERKHKTLKSWMGRKKKSILITDPLTSFVYTESVNKLAGRVDRHRHKGEHVILVTSVMENEGKSTVSANLAISLAKKGKKVLLIDCDLRKPSCNLIFGITEAGVGTVDVLQGKVALTDAVKYIKGSDIYLLTARKSIKTATNLLHSQAMENLLQEAEQNFDLVIVDVPPMAAAADAENICTYVDASLLVVRQNAATADALNDATAVLGRTSHLLGCVLNNVYGAGSFAPVHHYGAYGKYSKYGKYGKYGNYSYGKYGYGRYTADSGEEDE